MKYKIKATQIIDKFFDIEAQDESEAVEKAQTMAEEGEIHFDDEPFLNMEIMVKVIG